MPNPDVIGVESGLLGFINAGRMVRARFRLIRGPGQASPDASRLKVTIRTRIFDYDEVRRRNLVPHEPLAEGPALEGVASTDWQEVDLALPELKRGLYSVAAKVRSADESYPRPFEPSNCYISIVPLEMLQMRVADLRQIYDRGLRDPIAQEIRSDVEAGAIIALDETGKHFRAFEDGGTLRLENLSPGS